MQLSPTQQSLFSELQRALKPFKPENLGRTCKATGQTKRQAVNEALTKLPKWMRELDYELQ